MIVIRIDAAFGAKYVALIQGRIRECFLIAVTLDRKCKAETPQYVLDAAGIGEVRIDIPYTSCFLENDEPKGIPSILAETYDDFMNGNFVKYQQLDDTEPRCWEAMQELVPGFSFDPQYGIVGYIWNKERLRPEEEFPNWNYWRFDANGFATDIVQDYYYKSREDCINANLSELSLVTF